MSPEIKSLLADKAVLRPIYIKYSQEVLGLSRPDYSRLKTPEAMAYYNKNLEAQGQKLRVTKQNIDLLFSNIFGSVKVKDFSGYGVSIQGGGGNVFGSLEISGTGNALTLKDTKDNKFEKTKITVAPLAPPP